MKQKIYGHCLRTFVWIFVFATQCLAAPQTFTVTNTSCQGSGSFREALNNANTNPGVDTIEFTAGLTVDFGYIDCGANPLEPSELLWTSGVSESLIINGNDATLHGNNFYASPSAQINPLLQDETTCPNNSTSGYTILGLSPGFLRLGTFDAGASGIEVTVNDLNFSNLGGLFDIRQGGKLTINNVTARDTRDIVTGECATPAITAHEGADLSVTGLTITGSKAWASRLLGERAVIVGNGPNGGDTSVLEMKNIELNKNYMESGIIWQGDVRLENVSMQDSGGLYFSNSTVQIVNSLFKTFSYDTPRDYKWFYFSDSDAEIRASTFYIDGTTPCKISEGSLSSDGCVGVFPLSTAAHMQVAGATSTLNLYDSAVHVYFEDSSVSEPIKLLDVVSGGTITADENTFIQPDSGQSAASLKSLTNQPNLITDAPALPRTTDFVEFLTNSLSPQVTPLLEQSGVSGLLIDVVHDADCGQVNALQSPIDGSCITTDILGNARVDANGRRNVGAVQTFLSSHLLVSNEEKTGIQLSWSQNSSSSLTGYSIYCGLSGSSNLTRCLNVSGASTLQATVPGLKPDTKYDFVIVGVDGNGEGPTSNLVTGMTLPDAHLDYPVGRGEVGKAIRPLKPHTHDIAFPATYAVSSGNLPDGLSIDSGTGFISGTPTLAGTTTFSVTVLGVGGHSASTEISISVKDQVKKTTPHLDYGDGRGEVKQELIPLRPHINDFRGKVSYAISSGSLPRGLKLNPSTGVISGTPLEDGTFTLRIQATGSNGSDSTRVQIIVRPAPEQPHSTPAEAEIACGLENLIVPEISQCQLPEPKVGVKKSRYRVSLSRGSSLKRRYRFRAIPLKQENVQDNRRKRKKIKRENSTRRHARFHNLAPGCWAFQIQSLVDFSKKTKRCSKFKFLLVE